MPNYCSNSLSLSGPIDKIKPIWDRIQETKTFLEVICPLGEWDYDKALDTWGTKWDIEIDNLSFEEDKEEGRGSINGFFDSAWSPPVEALESFCNRNEGFLADLDYFEPGAGFVGRWDSETGDEQYEIDPDNLEDIPQEMREDWGIDEWYNEDEDEEEDNDEEETQHHADCPANDGFECRCDELNNDKKKDA